MPLLQVQLLGNFRLVYDHELITAVNQPRLQSLLAYLLFHCQTPQSRQQVAYHFWPDSTERQARTNLRRELYHLRQALPNAEQYLHTDARSVQWLPDAPFTYDVALFEDLLKQAQQALQTRHLTARQAALEEALQQYQGRLLPNCYDEWVLSERERLEQRFLRALEALILLLEEQRDYATAIQYAQRLLRHDPLHEPTYRRLMRLHARNGDRAGALRVYHTCADLLARELGVEPSQETQEAHTRLLNLETPARLHTRTSPVVRTVSHLVGRQPEWQQLWGAWRKATGGQAQLFLITGEAGIGKTRLAEELFESVSRQGIIAARTRSYAAEGALAYAPIVEWLRSAALHTTLGKLDAVWLTEVARLLPELLVADPDLPPPEPLHERWQRQRLFEALARAILLDEHPRLLLIDDLQWSDPETLEWLRYLLRFAPRARLLIVGTVRIEEIDADHPLTDLTIALRRAGQLTEVDLAPLNPEETANLATQVAGRELDPVAQREIYQATEGNPLFVVETMRAHTEQQALVTGKEDEQTCHPPRGTHSVPSAPPKVQALIQARLGQLSPHGRALAGLAATIGRSFTFAVLCQASAEDEETVVRGLDELWQRRIVREQGINAYDFSHDRIREAAYAALSPVRRRLLHRRAAAALEAVHAADLDDVSGQIAMHYEEAGLVESALAHYQRAATVASHLFAEREAAAHLTKGLDIIRSLPKDNERVDQEIAFLVALGDALTAVDGFSATGALAAYSLAWELSLPRGSSIQQFWALRGLRISRATRGEWRVAQELSEQLLALALGLENLALTQSAHHLMGAALLNLGELVLARHHFEEALAIDDERARKPSGTGGVPQQIDIHFDVSGTLPRLAQTLWLLGFPDQARQRSMEVDAVAQLSFSPVSHAFVYQHTAMLNQWLGNIEEVRTRSQAIMALTTQYELSFFQALGILLGGWVLVAQEQIAEGTAQMRRALALLRDQENTVMSSYNLSLLATAYAQAGRVNQALATLDEALIVAAQTDDHVWDAELHRQKGELLLSQQANHNEVERCLHEAVSVARRQSAKSLELRATLSLSRLWQCQGKHAQARRMLAEIYHWFSEGFDTPDLQAAMALLDELS